MQRKGNAIKSESQVRNQTTAGIDMGGSLWATAVQNWETGKMSYYGFRDKDGELKESRVFDLVSGLLQSGKAVDVCYKAGRYGYWPGGLHPSDHVPTVYIPTLPEEGRRDAEREHDRLKTSIGRVNAQLLALIERTPLPNCDGMAESGLEMVKNAGMVGMSGIAVAPPAEYDLGTGTLRERIPGLARGDSPLPEVR